MCSLAQQQVFSYGVLAAYLLIYSMVQNPFWEANWFAASQEIPRISRKPKVHYRTHKRPPPVSILGTEQASCMWVFLNKVFYREGLLAPRPTPTLEDHPSSAVRLLIQFIRSYPPYRRPFLYPQPEDAPCRSDRDLLHGISRIMFLIEA